MTTPTTTVRCERCDGLGRIARYAGIAGGVCFDCGGAGTLTAGTLTADEQAAAKARGAAIVAEAAAEAAAYAAKAPARWDAWAAERPELADVIARNLDLGACAKVDQAVRDFGTVAPIYLDPLPGALFAAGRIEDATVARDALVDGAVVR